MPDQDLPERVRSYLSRQRAWITLQTQRAENMLLSLSDAAEPDLEAALAELPAALAQLDEFEREQRGLLAEWRDEATDPEIHLPVQIEAAEVAQLAAQLQTLHGQLAQAILAQQAQVTLNTQALGKGRETLRAYRSDGDDTAGLVDRDA